MVEEKHTVIECALVGQIEKNVYSRVNVKLLFLAQCRYV